MTSRELDILHGPTDSNQVEHLDPAAGHSHTLTVTDSGHLFITEHHGDDTIALHSICLAYKIAVHAFSIRVLASPRDQTTAEATRAADGPSPGVYRIALGDDSNLHVFGRIHPSPNEQETTP